MGTFPSKDRIVAGVSFDVPGLGYKDPRTGVIDGFEVDVVRAVAQKLFGGPGHVDFSLVKDNDRIPALQSGRVDVVASQLTITPDREELVDFTVPYFVAREGLLVPEESPIKTFEDLKGRRISVTDGSISMRRMRAGVPDAKLVITTFSSGNLEAVEKGEADAASNDLINLTLMQTASPHPERFRLIDIGDHFDKKPFGIAVKKGNKSLIKSLNDAIEDLKAQGVIDKLMNENIASVEAASADAVR
jgi:putative glutamine transport system substrate-binding protein